MSALETCKIVKYIIISNINVKSVLHKCAVHIFTLKKMSSDHLTLEPLFLSFALGHLTLGLCSKLKNILCCNYSPFKGMRKNRFIIGQIYIFMALCYFPCILYRIVQNWLCCVFFFWKLHSWILMYIIYLWINNYFRSKVRTEFGSIAQLQL